MHTQSILITILKNESVEDNTKFVLDIGGKRYLRSVAEIKDNPEELYMLRLPVYGEAYAMIDTETLARIPDYYTYYQHCKTGDGDTDNLSYMKIFYLKDLPAEYAVSKAYIYNFLPEDLAKTLKDCGNTCLGTHTYAKAIKVIWRQKFKNNMCPFGELIHTRLDDISDEDKERIKFCHEELEKVIADSIGFKVKITRQYVDEQAIADLDRGDWAYFYLVERVDRKPSTDAIDSLFADWTKDMQEADD